MVDFADIAQAWDDIKDEPEILDQVRVTENEVKGVSADDLDNRQAYLPSEEVHYKNSARLADMFSKTHRSGAQSSLHGLILPGGRKNFNDFHDNYTGTGRIAKKSEGRFIPSADAPQNDGNTPKASVVLFERCIECVERVRQDDVIPDLDIIPPADRFEGELDKWGAVGLKPGMIVGSFFCGACVLNFRKEHQAILNNPFTSAIKLAMPDGSMTTVAAQQAEIHKHEHRQKTRENIIRMVKQERDNPDSQCFYGAGRLTESVV